MNWINPLEKLPELGKVYLVACITEYDSNTFCLTFMILIKNERNSKQEINNYFFRSLHNGHKARGAKIGAKKSTHVPREEVPVRYVKAYLDPNEIAMPEWLKHECECECKKRE